MFVGLAGFGGATVREWPTVPITDQSIAATGGLGLYIEDSAAASGMTASGTVELRKTSYPNVDLLVLDIDLNKPVSGTRWYFLASGAYASSPSLELNAFCSIGGIAVKVATDRIECPNRGNPELPGVLYDWDDTLGRVFGDEIFRLTDGLMDFDPNSGGMMVSGIVSDDDDDVVVWIPIERSTGARSGSSTTFSYPGIGGGLRRIGGNMPEPVRNVAPHYEDSSSNLAVISTGVPVRSLAFESLRFEVPSRRAPGRLEWSSPEPDEQEMLAWTSHSGRMPPVSFTFHDIVGENEMTRRTLHSGILGAIAVGFGLLLVEHLFHHNRNGSADGS